MKPLRVNADYEVELFHKKLAPEAINHTIEFFLFFLTNEVLYTKKQYSSSYLDHVEKLTGVQPRISSKTPFDNYWGLLEDLESERWWNSKITSTELLISKNWCDKTHILKISTPLPDIDWSRPYVLKDPFAMSGQKFVVLRTQDSVADKLQMVKKALVSGPQIFEPLFERKYDFSQYVFPDQQIITYENSVDAKFQYKGSTFSPELSFRKEVSPENWKQFRQQTQEIIQFYSQKPNEVGFSIDSFVYWEDGEMKIRVMSEINYRRTMGRVAYELTQKYAPMKTWSALRLYKTEKHEQPLWDVLKSIPNVMVLSPGDSRFDILFFFADSEAEGIQLLADTELAIKI